MERVWLSQRVRSRVILEATGNTCRAFLSLLHSNYLTLSGARRWAAGWGTSGGDER